MNWYRQASPALYEPRRLNPQIKATKFFNYLKAQNIRIAAYHGTNEESWQSAQKSGYLLAPKVTKRQVNDYRVNDNVDPDSENGVNQVFMSFDKNYASGYTRKFSKPILLTLNVPLYAIAEIQSAIFNVTKKVYNEQAKGFRISKIVQYDIPDSQKVTMIVDCLKKSSEWTNFNEFTCWMGIPIKWVTNIEKLS